MTTFVVAPFAGVAFAAAAGAGLLAASKLLGGRRRSSRRRHGRDTISNRVDTTQEEDWEAVARMLESVRLEDDQGCGLRLMCELAQDDDPKTQEELSILNLVEPWSAVRPGEGLLPNGALGEYVGAAVIGRGGENCAAIYNNCPMDAAAIMSNVMNMLP